jgi:hypothetical protein
MFRPHSRAGFCICAATQLLLDNIFLQISEKLFAEQFYLRADFEKGFSRAVKECERKR